MRVKGLDAIEGSVIIDLSYICQDQTLFHRVKFHSGHHMDFQLN